MRRKSKFKLTAAGAVTLFGIAACGDGGGDGGGGDAAGSGTYNGGLNAVVRPSANTGGTVTFDNSSVPDSTDPGNTYYANQWNVIRLYGRSLLTYESAPGSRGNGLVPDLATSLGKVSDNGLTWTYQLKPGVKFEDGSVVTSQDVKYAVERSYAKDVLPNGPGYFSLLLKDPNYPGPYKDKTPDKMGLSSVTTPNARTIVFHLAKPFSDFNYVVALPQTVPVPPEKDKGANYQLHPISTGPYKFQSYQLDKQFTLVRNPHWDAATDPNRKQLASKFVFNLNVNADTIDNNLIHNFSDVDQAGTGVQAAARAEILSDSSLRKNADNALSGFLWFTYINSKVQPLDNVHCRRAIEYAADKVAYQTAYGGPVAGGQIASTVLTPNIIGYKKFDLYGAITDPHGNVTKARQELRACGEPDGFSTTMAFRSDRPKERATATAQQQALSRVGINLTLQGFPSGKYFTNFAGVPNYVHQHNLGLAVGGWAPDWPDGYGMLYYVTAGPAIQAAGNTNIGELNDPAVNGMFTKAVATKDPAARNQIWSQIDRKVMEQAVILPGVYAKSLLYRSPDLTNVFVHRYYAMYNYSTLGLKG
ncbi:MAG: ABC transporter substrate-binding protein [Nocardiopsaceae bacterium]|jgi:peptide/nickel transport system substrate-binding protein|nr:ABC transporter substrate-binding protein [Nocardiopsaceae bacterium]